MNKIIVLLLLVVSTKTTAQNCRLLTIGPKSTIRNFGAMHKLGAIGPNDYWYQDTVSVNSFFRELARNVNPKKVVLITEKMVRNYGDTIRETFSSWVTPEMKALGFKKWIPADNRKSDVGVYFQKLEDLASLMSIYYMGSIKITDTLGYPTVTVTQTRTPMLTANKNRIMSDLTAVEENYLFEKNLQRLCTLVRKKGFIPIIVAGREHVMNLHQPSVIQAWNLSTDKETENEALRGYLTTYVQHFVLNEYKTKYNWKLVEVR
jgi:hypothetical protein